MQYAFAARGWQIEPWEETAQMDKNKAMTTFAGFHSRQGEKVEALSGHSSDRSERCFVSPLLPVPRGEKMLVHGVSSMLHPAQGYPGGKPTYNIKLKKEDIQRNGLNLHSAVCQNWASEDEKLVRQQPEKYQQTNSVCQLCAGPRM